MTELTETQLDEIKALWFGKGWVACLREFRLLIETGFSTADLYNSINEQLRTQDEPQEG